MELIIEQNENKTQKSNFPNTNLTEIYDVKSYSPEKEGKLLEKNNAIENIKAINPIFEYSSFSENFPLEVVKNSNKLGMKKYNNAIYFGEMLNNQRHGLGVMRYIDGRLYEGTWRNDIRFGIGFEKWPNLNYYEGEFSEGKPNGFGKFHWNSGEIYEGNWYKGFKHGDGIWSGSGDDNYTGKWKYGKPDGYGIRKWPNKQIYEGDWKEGLKHGAGLHLFPNGDFYVGHFRDGKFEGVGKYVWSDGSIFIGKFRNDLKEGFGRWQKSELINSNRYEGFYHNDLKQGFGRYIWQDGGQYIGQFQNDERNGIGEMVWSNGCRFIGYWKNGIPDGYGRLIRKNQQIREGIYQNNIFLGQNDNFQISSKELIKIEYNINNLIPNEFFKYIDYDFEQDIDYICNRKWISLFKDPKMKMSRGFKNPNFSDTDLQKDINPHEFRRVSTPLHKQRKKTTSNMYLFKGPMVGEKHKKTAKTIYPSNYKDLYKLNHQMFDYKKRMTVEKISPIGKTHKYSSFINRKLF